MKPGDGTRIHIRNTWNGWQGAEVRIDDLHDVHWWQPAGAPHPMLHGYVLCTHTYGHLPHSCDAIDGPHRLLVCVLRRCVSRSVYQELERRASRSTTVGVDEGTLGVRPGARFEELGPRSGCNSHS